MNEIFKIIIIYAKDYPILIPFVVFGFFYIKNTQFRNLTNKTAAKIFRMSFSNYLYAHDLFFQKKLWFGLIERIQFSGKHKAVLYRILLKEKINSVFTTIETVLKENKKNLRKMHGADVLALMLEILNTAVRLFEQNLLKCYISQYGEYTGKRLFTKIYTENYKAVQDENINRIVKRIGSPAFLSSRNADDMFRSFFTKIQDRLDDAVADAKETFDYINGGIEEIIHKQ